MNRINRRESMKRLAWGGTALVAAHAKIATGNEPVMAAQAKKLSPVDVLICGGGPAGIAAAMMAARLGQKTLIVERYGRLGGMAVQALVGPLMGHVQSAWVDLMLEQIGGRIVDYEFIDLKYADLLEAAGAEILLHTRVVTPLLDGKQVTGARLLTRQGLVDVPAPVVVDATGDGEIAFAAGAEFDQGRDAGPEWSADGLTQPMTIMFRVSGVNHAETMEARGGRNKFRFPDGRSWNELTKAANQRGELPESVGFVRTYLSQREDQRVINATQVNRLDGTNVWDLTRAELEARKQVPSILEFLRQNAPGFRDAYVSGMPAVIGVRETRRIRGLAYLTVQDLLAGRETDRAVVRRASFPVDIHNPSGIGQAQGVSEAHPLGKDPKVQPYGIPYGCLIPRGIGGLLVAGRCISGSHEAMASYRVQVIAMATGVAAGTAAALAAKQQIEPREVDVAKIREVVFREKVAD